MPTAWSLACKSTTTGFPSEWSIALAKRLRKMRSMRRESASIVTGSSGILTCTSTFNSSARCWTCASAESTQERASNEAVERSATPASWREISSRSASNSSKRSSSRIISADARRVCGSRESGSAAMRSAAMRTVVNGVRSSWETSEVNWRWRSPYSSSWLICFESLSAMSLKEPARRPISSSELTTIRSRKWPAARRCAMRDAERMGTITCCVASQAMPTSNTTTTTPAAESKPRMRAIVASSDSIDSTR